MQNLYPIRRVRRPMVPVQPYRPPVKQEEKREEAKPETEQLAKAEPPEAALVAHPPVAYEKVSGDGNTGWKPVATELPPAPPKVIKPRKNAAKPKPPK